MQPTLGSFVSFTACLTQSVLGKHVRSKVMAKEKLPKILVRWEGNQSKRYGNTVEEIWLSSVVAIKQDGCSCAIFPGPGTCWRQHRVRIRS